MLALLALGRLKGSRAFPADNISEEQVDSTVHLYSNQQMYYPQLVTPLREAGRPDLARAIERKMAIYFDREPGLKGWAKRFDRKYLHGNLAGFKRAIHNRAVGR